MTEIKQPNINIGLLGHVANGKSSLVRALTGEKTARGDSRCMQKGESREMTIQVGYSNAKIYQCGHCPKPDCYNSIEGSSTQIPECDNCGLNDNMKLVQFVSITDCPGHRNLMRNMISGSAVMDCAILVIDANKIASQIQTFEHLAAAEIVGIDHYVAIAQNKIDLLLDDPDRKKILLDSYDDISNLVKDTAADITHTPVIPTCFSPARKINLKLLLQHIVERAKPNPNPIYAQYPLFIYCIRSFDINKPCPAKNLSGGVIGGTIMHGNLKVGDLLEIRPGYKTPEGNYRPLFTKVTSLYTGKTSLTEAGPGGLIGIGTTLDPALTRADVMVGMCAGLPDKMPEVRSTLELKIRLLATGIGHEKEVQKKVQKIIIGERLQISIGSGTILATVTSEIKKHVFSLNTAIPVCPVPGQNIPISRFVDGSWTIIGQGTLYNVDAPVREQSAIENVDIPDYVTVLDQTLETTEPLPEFKKLKIPPPIVTKDGGARLIWTNFNDTCKILGRDETHVTTFFHEELATRTTINGIHQMVIHGKNRYQSRHIQSILVKYITAYVSCPLCKSVYTTLTSTTGKYTQLLCQKCGAEYLR